MSYGCKRLEGKVALVIAATRGIGLACAQEMAAEGASVYLGVRRIEAGREAAEAIRATGGKADAVYFDAFKPETYESMIADTVKLSGGKLHIMVNNFGGTKPETDLDVLSTDIDIFTKNVVDHLNSVFLSTKFAIPHMIACGGGSIINISSMAAVMPDITRIAYTTAKSAVNNMTLNIATQYGHKGIRCNAVMPGMIGTEAVSDNLPPEFIEAVLRQIPLNRMGQPADIARTVCYFASDDAAYVTGQCIEVAGGMGVPTPFYADTLSQM